MKAEAMLIGQVETLWVVFFNPPHFIEFTFKQGQKKVICKWKGRVAPGE